MFGGALSFSQSVVWTANSHHMLFLITWMSLPSSRGGDVSIMCLQGASFNIHSWLVTSLPKLSSSRCRRPAEKQSHFRKPSMKLQTKSLTHKRFEVAHKDCIRQTGWMDMVLGFVRQVTVYIWTAIRIIRGIETSHCPLGMIRYQLPWLRRRKHFPATFVMGSTQRISISVSDLLRSSTSKGQAQPDSHTFESQSPTKILRWREDDGVLLYV